MNSTQSTHDIPYVKPSNSEKKKKNIHKKPSVHPGVNDTQKFSVFFNAIPLVFYQQQTLRLLTRYLNP